MSAKYPERFSNNTHIHIKNLKDLMPSNALRDWCRENHIQCSCLSARGFISDLRLGLPITAGTSTFREFSKH